MSGPAFTYQQASLNPHLTLFFDVQVGKKYGLLKPAIPSLEVSRAATGRLKDILEHVETQLGTNSMLSQVLLKAVCVKSNGSHNHHLQQRQQQRQQLQQSNGSVPHRPVTRRGHYNSGEPMWNFTGVVPLVCNQIWTSILIGYPDTKIRILVDQNVPEVTLRPPSCWAGLLKRELKYLDVGNFLPSKGLKPGHVMKLCRDIFERGVKIKPELRRGVWLHLVGVFHPCLEAREDREHYIEKLRMTYDHLKGQLMGDNVDQEEKKHLVDAVHRDAIRTDPTHPFFADQRQRQHPNESYISQHYHRQTSYENGNETGATSNIDKLINIIVIYVLEHENISYTQGMTDILSPILYIMQDEADAYICFAAMVERIKDHFTQWCTGTLYKLERLKHLCEVLDPKLYHCLTANNEEDVFVLFFGMVLIECRREFSFEDSFHLLETVWASAACAKDSLPATSNRSLAEWAKYMTDESPEVLNQVFAESGNPYSAVPLPYNMSGSYTIGFSGIYSRNPSLISHSPTTLRRLHSTAEIDTPTSAGGPRVTGVIPEVPDTPPPARLSPYASSLEEDPLDVDDNDTSAESNCHRQISVGAEDPVEEEGQNRRDPPEPLCTRMRSQSDSKLKLLSSQSTLASTRSPIRGGRASGGGGGSPYSHSTDVEGSLVVVTTQNKLESSYFSHSESELYDSFSNSGSTLRGPPHLPPPLPFGRNPTEMSDMSSLSSGTASANNLIASFKSVDSRKSGNSGGGGAVGGGGGGGGRQRRLTPEGGVSSSRKARQLLPSKREKHSTSSDSTNSNVDGEGAGGREAKGLGACDGVDGGDEEGGSSSPVAPDSVDSLEFKDALDGEEERDGGDGEGAPSPSPLQGEGAHDSASFETVVAASMPPPPPPPSSSDASTTILPNHVVTTQAEVHLNGGPVGSSTTTDGGAPVFGEFRVLRDVEPEIVEHNGMITSMANHNKTPLARTPELSRHHHHHHSKDPQPHPHSDGDVLPRRRKSSSPKKIHRPRRDSVTDDHRISNCSTPSAASFDNEYPSSHRVTPVAFFDAMGKLASSAPGSQGFLPNPLASLQHHRVGGSQNRREQTFAEASHEGERMREGEGTGETESQLRRQLVNNSELEASLLMSQLISTEEGAPRIVSEDSVNVPFTDSYALFICLSILVQNREEILRNGADFYQLSTILNAQAASQDLERTLSVARQLYRVYRQYQRMWFGGDETGGQERNLCNEWLDAEVRSEGGATRRTSGLTTSNHLA